MGRALFLDQHHGKTSARKRWETFRSGPSRFRQNDYTDHHQHPFLVNETLISGGSRTFLRGANSQNGSANLYFGRKLHENERIWTLRGVSLGTPLDPPMLIDVKLTVF